MTNFQYLWTMICIFGAILVIMVFTHNRIYRGQDLTLHPINSQFTIDVESVTLEAASSEFFILRHEEDEVIVGKAVERSSWEGKYYKAGPVKINGGNLVVTEKKGDLTIHLTSSSNMSVKEFLDFSSIVLTWMFVVVIGFLIWLFGFLIMNEA